MRIFGVINVHGGRKEAKMLVVLGVILLTMQIMDAQSMDLEDSGMMPEIVVTAPRYIGEDIAYSGMMPEIVVTAPRYTEEDMVCSGIMPEIVVIGRRNGQSISDLALVRCVYQKLSLRSFNYLHIGQLEYRSLGLYN